MADVVGQSAATTDAQLPAAMSVEAISLERMVADIIAKNPERAFFRAEIDAAMAGRGTATAMTDPELSLELGHKRAHDSSGNLAGEGMTWSVSVSQTFEWPGRLALRKAVANQDIALAELGLEQFESALAARATVLVYNLHTAVEKTAAIHEVADRFSALRETLLARDPAGLTPQLEARIIEAAEISMQRQANEADLALKAAIVELNQLRGLPVATPVGVKPVDFEFRSVPEIDVLLDAARQNNFEFRSRQMELSQRALVTKLAYHERKPGFTLSPFLSRDEGDRETVIGLGVSMPLPVYGRSVSAIHATTARQRQAEVALQITEREMNREVYAAYHEYTQKYAEMSRWLPDGLGKFRESAVLADRHYRLGAVPIATYIELQKACLEAMDAFLDTQREAVTAGQRLQVLTGFNFQPIIKGSSSTPIDLP